MIKGEIQEYPYECTIYRVIEGSGMEKDQEVLLYDGVCDEHMTTYEEGRSLQTANYIISIPLVKDENDKWIVPRKGDRINLDRYGELIPLIVDNSEPSQLGGCSIMATRNSWDKKV